MVVSSIRSTAYAAPAPTNASAARMAAGLVRQAATLSTFDGRYVTGGIVEFDGTPREWSATLRDLDRAGSVASLFFAEGVRDVIVRLEDGRRARGRLTGTTFASAQRACTIVGTETFA